MLHYLFQALIFQAVFLGIYDLILRKETFFQWNRAYLVFTSVFSYLLPLIKIERASSYVQANFITIPDILLNLETIFLTEINLTKVKTHFYSLENLYYLGITITSILFLYKIALIVSKIYKNKVVRKAEYNLVILANQKTAFSFFKYLFLGKSLLEKEHQHIISHELTHINDRHSIDLMYFELQKIVFWFNPFSYLFQNRISVLHEYIADETTIKQKGKTTFFEGLLQQTFQVEKFSFVNQFYKKSLIKKRIIMVTKNKSKKVIKLKYLVLIPLLASMLIYTSCDKFENQEDEENINGLVPPTPPQPPKPISPVKPINIEETMPYSTIDEVPVYPGCEKASNKKKCMSDNITKHVFDNFNTDVANNLGLEAGRKRISVQFEIDKEGNIANIKARAPHIKLKEEAIRVVKLIPTMEPGKQNNKAINVRYSLPIIFKIK